VSNINVTTIKATRNLSVGKVDAAERRRNKTLEPVTIGILCDSKLKTINGLITRNGGRGLINILLQYVKAIRPRTSQSVVRQVAAFVFLLHNLVKYSGTKGAVLYLKACQVLLQQSVGGYIVADLADLKVRPKRTRSGLPRVIPAGVRVMIVKDRHIPSIKLWMTLFGFFRIMEFVGKLNLSTITQPGLNIDRFSFKWDRFIGTVFIPLLLKKIKLPKLTQPTLFPILKSGPTSTKFHVNTSISSLIASARLWLRMGTLFESLKEFASQLGAPALVNRVELVAITDDKSLLDNPELEAVLRYRNKVHPPVASNPLFMKYESIETIPDTWLLKELIKVRRKFIPSLNNPTVAELSSENKGFRLAGTGYLGKLGFKLEAAGKVRVFAMVDAWTQWVMAPLHDFVFDILSQLSFNDGTFNQLKPLSRLQVKFQGNLATGFTFASMDLSAATDRLPLKLQKIIIKHLFKDICPDSYLFSEAWGDLLVKRSYSLSITSSLREGAEIPATTPDNVLYSVGQPMGALSSWALLALTHHAIVQYAAYLAGFRTWFADYAVLGDDIVIMDANVANSYRQILSTTGVGVGMAKSIVAKSKFVCEFAKKFFVDSTQANMLPLKECISTSISTSLVLEFVRKYSLNLNQILAFLGYGYKARAKAVSSSYFDLGVRLRVILVWLSHPTSSLGGSRLIDETIPAETSPEFNNLWNYWGTGYMIMSGRGTWNKRNLKYMNPYPYVTWLLQERWQKPFEVVSEGALYDIKCLLYELLNKKYSSLEKLQARYQKSIGQFIAKLDHEKPVMVSGMNLWGSTERYATKQQLGWSNILSPDMSSLTQVVMNTQEGSAWDLDRNDTHQRSILSTLAPTTSFYAEEGEDTSVRPQFKLPLAKRSLKLDLRPYFGLVVDNEKEKLPQGGTYHKELLELELLLELLFTSHPLQERIPDTWWREIREEERPHKDFLEVYNIWQELSKVIWAENSSKEVPVRLWEPSRLEKSIAKKWYHKALVPIIGSDRNLKYNPFGLTLGKTLCASLRIWWWNWKSSILSRDYRLGHLNIRMVLRAIIRVYNDWVKPLLSVVSNYMSSNVYVISGYLVDKIVLVIVLLLIGAFIMSLDVELSTDPIPTEFITSEELDGDMSSKKRTFIIAAVSIGLLTLGLYLGYDMYHSYYTTLNYVDPLVKPLYLPPYAGIHEVIPSGLDRAEIISMFDSNILPPTLHEQLPSTTSPMHMHGFWE